MPDYTLHVTSDQDALLTWLVQRNNQEKELTLTNEQYLNATFLTLLQPYAEQFKESVSAQLQQAYFNATPDKQAQIKQILGVS